jgi:uncharacterized membrane protein YeiH
MNIIIFALEIIGTIAFAISGSIIGVKKQMDIFGVIFLGITTAIGGGIIRDTMISQMPPYVFSNYITIIIALTSSLLTYLFINFNKKNFIKRYSQIDPIINIFDAIGLGVFTINGINTAIFNADITNIFLALFVGLITGIGGGIIRDVLINDIPFVLRKKIYAVASLTGGIIYYILYYFDINNIFTMLIGIITIFVIRMLATKCQWDLPKIDFSNVS